MTIDINLKKEIMETYEQKGKSFFKGLDQRVKEEGFALVDIQIGQYKRPEVMPIVDGNPTHIDQVEAMVEKGRFPKQFDVSVLSWKNYSNSTLLNL